MSFEKIYYPNFPLNQFVELIWVGKEPNLEISSSHHAALFTELIFNYGDTFEIRGQNVENLTSNNSHQILSGLKARPFQTEVSGIYNNVGLILKPHCYRMLFKKFGLRVMENISEQLFEHLFETENPELNKIEKPLLEIFDLSPIDSDLEKFEKHLSTNMLKKGNLKDFNLSISISQKSFIQKFKNHFLITPSEYIRLKQVNFAIQLMRNNNSDSLTNIGLDSGFYDQSHFIRVFKKFCGVTPKEFITR